MKKTVLVLGAGASVDYGYPLWETLKQQIFDLDVRECLRKEAGLKEDELDAHSAAHYEYCTLAEKNPSFTLDRVIYEMDRPRRKHLKPTGHLLINIVGLILAKAELNKEDGEWVSELQSILIDYVLSMADPLFPEVNLLANLNVISLNYDRVFEHFISQNFYKKVVEHPKYSLPSARAANTFARSNKLSVYKPHGCLCRLSSNSITASVGMPQDLIIEGASTDGFRHPGNYTTVRYGSSRLVSARNVQRMGRYMYVVDEQESNAYRKANLSLKSADVVICLGLSHAGICQSSLEFDQRSKIYVSNKPEDIALIEKGKPGPKYLPLGRADRRMDAINFPKEFKSICL